MMRNRMTSIGSAIAVAFVCGTTAFCAWLLARRPTALAEDLAPTPAPLPRQPAQVAVLEAAPSGDAIFPEVGCEEPTTPSRLPVSEYAPKVAAALQAGALGEDEALAIDTMLRDNRFPTHLARLEGFRHDPSPSTGSMILIGHAINFELIKSGKYQLHRTQEDLASRPKFPGGSMATMTHRDRYFAFDRHPDAYPEFRRMIEAQARSPGNPPRAFPPEDHVKLVSFCERMVDALRPFAEPPPAAK
jgi:hypothetical protein